MVLSGVVVIVVGFLLGLNPLLVVTASACVTGLAAGMAPLVLLADFGRAFNDARYVSVVWVVLPVVGLLEHVGLQDRAQLLVKRFAGATVGRLLLAYLMFRQLTSALGLTSIAGPAHTVRPLLAPMAEAAATAQLGRELDGNLRERIKALCAATDNIGLFFGEDLFLAIGSILLMKGFLQQYGIELEPFQLSVWAIPTALAALIIHGWRVLALDRQLEKNRVTP